jgi:hypothetical protein
MERLHLENGGSIGLAEVETESGIVTRLNILGDGPPTTVTLTDTEQEDLAYLVDMGVVRVRCAKCGCVQERACIRVEGERIVEVCGWAELEPKPICTACAEGAASTWKHPSEQEEEFEQSFAMAEEEAPSS